MESPAKTEKSTEIKNLSSQLNKAIKEAEEIGLTILINGSTQYQGVEIQIQEITTY